MKQSMIMLDFVHAESKRLKIVKSTRRRFSSHQHGWRKQENIRRLIILIKLIYAIIFICLTISTYLNQSIEDNIQCSKTFFIRIWDIWFTILSLILMLSLLIDRFKRQNLIPLKIINAMQISLLIAFIIFVILGHIQAYRLIWQPLLPSNELTRSTILSIIFLDLCPISIAVMIIIHSLKTRRSWRRIHTSTLISSV